MPFGIKQIDLIILTHKCDHISGLNCLIIMLLNILWSGVSGDSSRSKNGRQIGLIANIVILMMTIKLFLDMHLI